MGSVMVEGVVPPPSGGDFARRGLEDAETQKGVERGFVFHPPPKFVRFLKKNFPSGFTGKEVAVFMRGMMQMVQDELNREKKRHERDQQRIRRKLAEDEG